MMLKHWSNSLFYDDLNLILNDNICLFNYVQEENFMKFSKILKNRLINALLCNVFGYRKTSLISVFLEKFISLEFQKIYQINK